MGRINRLLTGWANYFTLGQVSPAYAAIDQHATRRLVALSQMHKVRSGKSVRFPDERLWTDYGLTHLETAYDELSVGEGMISSESRMRENRPSGSMSGDWKRSHGGEVRHRHCESRRKQLPPSAYRHRASRRLY